MQRLAGRRVYIDSNVFIYFLDRSPALAQAADRVMAFASSGACQGVTGDLAVAEVLVGAYRHRDDESAERIRGFFRTPDLLTVVSHSSADFVLAARVRGEQGAALVDALHVATALNAGCTVLVTNDARMPSVPGLEVVRLQEFEQLDR